MGLDETILTPLLAWELDCKFPAVAAMPMSGTSATKIGRTTWPISGNRCRLGSSVAVRVHRLDAAIGKKRIHSSHISAARWVFDQPLANKPFMMFFRRPSVGKSAVPRCVISHGTVGWVGRAVRFLPIGGGSFVKKRTRTYQQRHPNKTKPTLHAQDFTIRHKNSQERPGDLAWPCLRYDPLPMCPGRTTSALHARKDLNPQPSDLESAALPIAPLASVISLFFVSLSYERQFCKLAKLALRKELSSHDLDSKCLFQCHAPQAWPPRIIGRLSELHCEFRR